MSVGYRAVGWNAAKRRYDLVVALVVLSYLGAFVGVGAAADPSATAETLLLRALGSGALLSLHLVLAIGPLARLDRRFLPLLYNRRHLGVTTFLLALAHGGLALVQFHALGDTDPLVSLLSAGAGHGWVPFQPLGLAALAILFVMAATSHDFWLASLGAPAWKALHMGVYVAYVLVVGHVALGTLQAEEDPLLAGALGAGALLVGGLHVVAGRRERALDAEHAGARDAEGFVDAGDAHAIADGRARIVTLGGERVAVFRHGARLSAVSNVCRHQAGPLGEGRILDGCITCPWHGYQYRPEDGASPPPFTERVATYRVRVAAGRVLVHPQALAPGTYVEPARLPEGGGGA